MEDKKSFNCGIYTITMTKENSVDVSCNNFSFNVIYYYNSRDTKYYHAMNLKYGFSFINKCKGLYTQLIGSDMEIYSKTLYKKLINIRINQSNLKLNQIRVYYH